MKLVWSSTPILHVRPLDYCAGRPRAAAQGVRPPGQNAPALHMQPLCHDAQAGHVRLRQPSTCRCLGTSPARTAAPADDAPAARPRCAGPPHAAAPPRRAGPPRTAMLALHVRPLRHDTSCHHVGPLGHDASALHVRSLGPRSVGPPRAAARPRHAGPPREPRRPSTHACPGTTRAAAPALHVRLPGHATSAVLARRLGHDVPALHVRYRRDRSVRRDARSVTRLGCGRAETSLPTAPARSQASRRELAVAADGAD